MKILHIIDSLGPGGKERQLIELLKGLKMKEDMDSELVILSNNIHYPYINELNHITYVLERKNKKDPSIFVKLHGTCKKTKPDIIHSWESMCSVYAIPITKILGIKSVDGAIRDAPSNLKLFEKGWIRAKLTFPFADMVLANSHAGLKSYNAPKHKSFCIHNGFDLSRIDHLEAPDVVKKRFDINSKKIIGMVAGFSLRKDYETYICAAMKILQKRNDVTFLAVGEGSALEKCREIVQPEFQGGIKFIGKQDDIESIVNIFDIGVLATYTEGISNSILEYMALAKPVVATACDGTSEIVINNKTGFLVKPANVDDMIEKIEFLVNNEEAADAMGKAGKERVLKEFSIEKMIKKHIALYQKCLDTSRSRSCYYYV